MMHQGRGIETTIEQPWNDERVITEAEAIASNEALVTGSWFALSRKIISALRRQALAQGYHYEARAQVLEAKIAWLEADNATLQAELAERVASFEMRHESDMRAIKLWQEATGKELIWPNHADLCVWLMQELTTLRANGHIPQRDTVGGLITAEWDTPGEDAAWEHLQKGGDE